MNRMGNGNGNSNGLPFHANGGSRKNAFSSITNNARRISPGRLFILMGLCVVSLIAVTRWASGKESHIPFDHLERDGALTDREIVVRHILDSRKSHYSFDDFTEDGLVAPGNEHLRPATAILLGWKRLDGLKLVVNYLARYPYIKEIIIWNNNKDMTLTARDFDFDKSFGPLPELNIHNGKENMHDYSKYMSCALAKYDHCYFQDDDWLNTHMDALYTNFLTSPTLIHTNTMPMIHIEHKRWSFTNDEVRMHTGFAWLGTGSFLPREKASGLMSQASSGNLAKARLRVIDMYFSIWTNQYPYQLVNYLTPLDQKDGWSDATDHWSIVFRNMLDAADRLYSALLANPEVSEKDSFVREEERPYIAERHVRYVRCFHAVFFSGECGFSRFFIDMNPHKHHPNTQTNKQVSNTNINTPIAPKQQNNKKNLILHGHSTATKLHRTNQRFSNPRTAHSPVIPPRDARQRRNKKDNIHLRL